MPSTLTNARVHNRPSREEGAGVREHRSDAARTHESVMVTEVLEALQITSNDTVLDATAGLGGHSEAFLKAGAGKVVALDADPTAVAMARARLLPFGERAQVVEANFRDSAVVLGNVGVTKLTKALFDLGWNMTQLNSGRGFSFLSNDELNMSYGTLPASGFNAKEIINTWKEKVLADIFYGYGEEQYARRIAKAIVEAREEAPITTAGELAEVIKTAVPAAYRRGRIHPATKSFQALRIAVNDELGSIEKGIAGAWDVLQPGGRIAVITFHSIEDRLVKRLFAALAKEGKGKLVTKKPVPASKEEIITNPSSRSAKVRAIEKM